MAAYEEKTGMLPGEWSAGCYDAIYVLADALSNEEAQDLYGNDLVEWMKENTDYSGVTGEIKFNENGDNISCKAHFIQVQNGAFQHFEP